jgi:hypothetical protein
VSSLPALPGDSGNTGDIQLVKDTLAKEGIEITATGSLDYSTIDELMAFIDNYFGGAARAVVSSEPVSARTNAVWT